MTNYFSKSIYKDRAGLWILDPKYFRAGPDLTQIFTGLAGSELARPARINTPSYTSPSVFL